METVLNKFIEEMDSAYDMSAAYDIVDKYCDNESEFIAADLNVFRYKSYFIHTVKRFYGESYCKTLAWLSTLNIKCAPRLAYARILGNGDDMVMIKHIVGHEGGELRRFAEARKQVDTNAKYALLDDYDILAANGLYNKAMLATIRCWYVASNGSILVDHWGEWAKFANDSEKTALRRELQEMAGLR